MSDAVFGRHKRTGSTPGYTRPLPSFEGASNANDPLQRLSMDKNFHRRLQALETKTGTGSFSSDKQSPVTQPPSRAQLTVKSGGTNLLSVAITNPETIDPKNNPSRSPVIHKIETSNSLDFSQGTTKFQPSTQNHYMVPTSGKPLYVKISSSLDGVNFNTEQISGPHQ